MRAGCAAAQITAFSQSRRVNPGQLAAFNAKVLAPRNASFQWYKDGRQLVDELSSTLFIANAAGPEHAGRYHCISRSPAGTFTSPTAELVVNGACGLPPQSSQ